MSGREHASQGAEAAEHRPPAQPRQEGQHLPPAATQRNHSGAGGGCSARTRRNGGGGLEWGRVQHLFYVLGELESFSGDANHFLAAHGLRALARWLPAAVGTAAAAAVQVPHCECPTPVFTATEPRLFRAGLNMWCCRGGSDAPATPRRRSRRLPRRAAAARGAWRR
ncbi:hypothetical protein OsI_29511 [Oryza sativa Indica Group]|uniref:Uncharacterized protein n=1 Tax=Oryza sativa subsp. indica TaxID=39946 RepID=B8BBI3_ORYSI|nr:hypothetical protein OsI_29511 [Oryza sativa Indica Group]